MERGHFAEHNCLNCGATLAGPYCRECGQAAHLHRTLGAFLHDLSHGVLHFEGTIWRTLPLLAWRPGRLTREYIDGRRASYVSPVALFLFATFLMFAVFHAIGEPVSFDNVKVDGVAQGFGQAETSLDADLAKLEADRKAALAAHKPTDGIDARIAQTKSSLGTVRALHTGSLGALAEGAGQPAARADNPVDRVWQKAKANPDLLIYKLQANAYKYSWLLIPISVPFVWLLFAWRREFGLYDHTVFVTYSLSFMMLALTIAGVGGAFGLSPLVAIPVLYAPFHLYRQLRGTYGIGRVGALVRTAFLIAFAAAALTLWALAIIAMLLEG